MDIGQIHKEGGSLLAEFKKMAGHGEHAKHRDAGGPLPFKRGGHACRRDEGGSVDDEGYHRGGKARHRDEGGAVKDGTYMQGNGMPGRGMEAKRHGGKAKRRAFGGPTTGPGTDWAANNMANKAIDYQNEKTRRMAGIDAGIQNAQNQQAAQRAAILAAAERNAKPAPVAAPAASPVAAASPAPEVAPTAAAAPEAASGLSEMPFAGQESLRRGGQARRRADGGSLVTALKSEQKHRHGGKPIKRAMGGVGKARLHQLHRQRGRT